MTAVRKKCFILGCMAMASIASYAHKEVTWMEKVHDFATFHEDDGKVTVTFKAVNTGDEPVQIVSARSTCGCTRPAFDSRPVNPGDTVKLQVSYDPTGRPGRFDKKIYVDLDTEPSRHTLHIRGTAIGNESSLNARYPIKSGNVRLQQDMLMFGDMTKGAIKSAYIECYNVSNDTIAVKLESAPEYIHLLTSPERIAPGEQAVMSATIYSVNAPDYGLLSDSIKIGLRQDGVSADMLTIPVPAFVKEDFSGLSEKALANAPVSLLSVDKVDLGNVSSAVSEPVTYTAVLSNSGKNALIVRRIYSPDYGVTVSSAKNKIKKGDRTPLTITISPEYIHGKEIINTSFVLITNDPTNPVRTVRIVGMID